MAKNRSWFGKIVLFVLLAGMAGGGYVGWNWMKQVTLTEIQIRGMVHAQETELLDLIDVDSGDVMFDISSMILADRLRRHPWIAEASVSRLPTGLLDIQVVERHPVAQVLGSSGRIEYFFDRGGYRMPVSDHTFYAVPIISGSIEAYHPVMPVQDQVLKNILLLLPRLSPESDALVSEIRRTGKGIEIDTTPIGGNGTIPVVLGRSDFAYKFRKLEAFWEQEVLLHQNIQYASIDLRFDSQIVTREEPRALPQ